MSDTKHTPDELRANFIKLVAIAEEKSLMLGPNDYEITREALHSMLDEPSRSHYLHYITGVSRLEDMAECQVIALMRVLKPTRVNGYWVCANEALHAAIEKADGGGMSDNLQSLFTDVATVPQIGSELYRDVIKLYGAGPDGKTCRTCAHCVATGINTTYHKCDMTKPTRGPSTDWRVSWPACGKYEAKGGKE